jgi:NADH:ubiquinone oxidoreductase subunit 3 (subunit A)
MYYAINKASCIAIAVVLTILATVVVILRLIQTGKSKTSDTHEYKPGAVRAVFLGWHLDDIFAVLALVCIVEPEYALPEFN